MEIQAGAHTLGPGDGSLTVRTGRTGAAAKAGHDLVMEVRSWEATIDVGAETSMTLTADSHSLHVIEATGGVGSMGDDEREGVRKSIDDDVLKGGTIAFRSTRVSEQDGALRVDGELDLLGRTHPVGFDLHVGDDGRLTATATVKQSDWGMKPYSILFGTLKVADEVKVTLDAHVPVA